MSELYYCECDPHGDNAKCDRPCARPNHERQLYGHRISMKEPSARQMRMLLERWLTSADSGIWRDRADLSLGATMLADDTRALLKGDES